MAELLVFFFFQAEDGIRDIGVTGVQTCALPIGRARWRQRRSDPSARSALARETDRTTAGATALPVSLPPLRPQEVRTIIGRYGQPRYVSTSPTVPLCAVGRHQYLRYRAAAANPC